jgi:hypothetical protein
MGILDSVSSAFEGAGETTDGSKEASEGAYWCDDCAVRVRDVVVDEEGLDREDGTPLCPDCGEPMRFERSHADGCAC